MKNHNSIRLTSVTRLLICLFFVFYASSTVMGQDKENNTSEVESAVTQLYAAMVAKDKTTLENLTLEAMSYGHSSGKIETKSEYVDGVLNGAFQFSAILPIDQTITIAGDTSVVRHIFEGEGTNNGAPATVRIGCLLVFQKQHQHWQLLARQAFKL